jgi:hypothetical protein
MRELFYLSFSVCRGIPGFLLTAHRISISSERFSSPNLYDVRQMKMAIELAQEMFNMSPLDH